MADDNAHLKSGPGTHIFRLKGLTTRVNLNQSANYAPYDVPPVNASYFMDISINSLLLDDLIFISAASNYIDNSKWPDISFSLGNINNSNKTDIDSYYVEHITKNIGPAWLAKNITGGYNNSDIFHNEDELVQQYITMDKSTSNLNYLQISPTDLSKKLALNKISIHDITSNTPVTLYSPDASGANFVTPGWVSGFDPSYALTTSDNEYLAYDTFDSSNVFIKYGFHTQIGHAYKFNIDCCNNNTLNDYNSNINVSVIDSANNKPIYLHYDDLNENNNNLDSSNILQIHNNIDILDASTNIVFYDNTIKSQLIKNLKKGGTSEANPVSGSNLPQYYIGTTNLGREIMLSMFASSNEYTIQRINEILTYKPPPVIYDIILGPGTKGDNSNNIVFYLNGVESPILHLTRGLDYEFNINGTDISKNKFIFTKELKTDGVDICLNPIDNMVITSGLTYEIQNNIVSFNDFYNNLYENTSDILHYIDFRPLVNGNLPLTIYTNNDVHRWGVSNIRLFNITTNTYITEIYPPTDSSGNNHVSEGYFNDDKNTPERLASTIGDPTEVFSDNVINEDWPNFILFHSNFIGEPFIRYAVFINPEHEYRVHVSNLNKNNSSISYTNVDILDQNFNKILTVNPNSGFYVYGENSPGNRAKDASGIFQISPTNHVYPSNIIYSPVTQRKIKWSIPFNEVNIPSNSFYSSDISDNLGNNIIINKNPIYGAMKFIDGDLIQYHLTYSQKAIVDASGVAIDSSGNKLGSNPIEDQDYIVRLHIHDLFHTPKLKIPTPHPIIFTIVNNLGPKNLSSSDIVGYDGDKNAAITSFLGNVQSKSFTISRKFIINSTESAAHFDLILGKWTGNSQDYFIGFWTETGGNPADIKFYYRIKDPISGDSDATVSLPNSIEFDVPIIITMTHDYDTYTTIFYQNEEQITTTTIGTQDLYTDFYIKGHGYHFNTETLESAFITHNILDISDISHIHDSVQTAISNGHIENTLLELPIYNLNTQIKYGFNFLSTEKDRNWRNWLTLDGSGIYLNNEASGNILGLQFATDSDEFGIGICSDICDNIWEEKPWEINKVPTDVSMISSNKFIWAFDASLNGNDYTYKIADTNGTLQDYDGTKLHNQKYNWKIEIKSDGTLCLKTSTDSALNVESTYSNIKLSKDTIYYLWIGSKDASFNFTNLKYLPETRVYDDKVTLQPIVQTSTQGSTASYNTYNVVEQTEVTYNLSTADITYLVTHAGAPKNIIFIDGNRYTEALPLVLIVGNTYRFSLENATNIDTKLSFSSEPSGVGIIYSDLNYNFITYNGTPGVYDNSPNARDRVAYVDVQITDNSPNKFYYYDSCGNNTDISGTIIVNTSVINHHVTVDSGLFLINGSNVTLPLQLPVGRHRFIQSHATNGGHPLKISTISDGRHAAGGSEYTDLVTYNGTPGTYDSYTELRIIDNIQNYYTYCDIHPNMGFQISNSNYVNTLSPHVIQVTVNSGNFTLTPNNPLQRDEIYIFIQADSTNASHPFRISTSLDGTDYIIDNPTAVTYYGTPGQSGSYTELLVPTDYNPGDLFFKCHYHSGMGGPFL